MKNNCLNCRWSPLWGKDNTYEQCFCEYPRDRIPSGIEYYKVSIVNIWRIQIAHVGKKSTNQIINREDAR